MTLSSTEITKKVIESADKYGSTNPQQIKQLSLELNKCDKESLFNGLYSVFLIEHENHFERQQLAGTLLYKIKPKLRLNLYEIIKNCLNTYNLSIEELPWYLSELCGKEKVIEIIKILKHEALSEHEASSLKTFEFWVTGNNG